MLMPILSPTTDAKIGKLFHGDVALLLEGMKYIGPV